LSYLHCISEYWQNSKYETMTETDKTKALRILARAPGVTVKRTQPSDKRADAVIEFAGQGQPVRLAFKRYTNAAGAWEAVRQASDRTGAQVLLVAERTTNEARRILREHRVPYVDGSAYAHVELPGLLIHTEGGAGPQRETKGAAQLPTKLSGRAGVAAQALLLETTRDWQVRDLAAAAHLSSSLAHRVFVRLEAEGVVEASGVGPKKSRRVTNPSALLDLWAEEAHDRGVIRALAFRLARTPSELATGAAAGLDDNDIPYAVTGAAAAAKIAPSITAVPVTEIWVAETLAIDSLLRAVEAEVVDSGHNLVLAQARDDLPLAFRRKAQDGTWMVNPLRLYVDLRNDPRRGREQAEHIRKEVIGF
jgi:hypothetical protein